MLWLEQPGCQGRSIEINGCAYDILRKIESPYAWVTYKIRNRRTTLSLFHLRIYRDRPGSPHYAGMVHESSHDAVRQRRDGGDRRERRGHSAARGLRAARRAHRPGAGRSRAGHGDGFAGAQRPDRSRLLEARELRLRRRPADALAIYETLRLLAQERLDARPAAEVAGGLENGQRQAAHAVVLGAVDLEPNDSGSYRQLAVFHSLKKE